MYRFDKKKTQVRRESIGKSPDLQKEKIITGSPYTTAPVQRAEVDFSSLDIPGAMHHVKYRDLSVKRKKGIGGCHDLREWNKLKQEASGYAIPEDRELSDPQVPDVLIEREEPHAVPKVKQVYYSMPSLKINNKTDGNKKLMRDPKTVYDPSLWTDNKLETSLKEAIQDSVNQKGILEDQWDGKTKEGYGMMGFIRSGKLNTFYFA